MRTVPRPRIITGGVAAGGTPNGLGDFSSGRNTTGDYTITLPADFRLAGVTASATISSAAAAVQVAGQGARSVRFLALAPAGTPVDAAITFTAVSLA
jgi:hypothetical protein